MTDTAVLSFVCMQRQHCKLDGFALPSPCMSHWRGRERLWVTITTPIGHCISTLQMRKLRFGWGGSLKQLRYRDLT